MKFRRNGVLPRLKLHSKIAIVTTLILLIAGTLLNFVLEYQNPETIGNLNTGQKIMASAFQAVTTRTAGFSTFQQSGMHEETGFLNIILMFIGGSPGGTAGGLKTTTFALLFLAFHTMLRGVMILNASREKWLKIASCSVRDIYAGIGHICNRNHGYCCDRAGYNLASEKLCMRPHLRWQQLA